MGYELCVPLRYGGQYLLFTKLHHARSDRFITPSVDISSSNLNPPSNSSTEVEVDEMGMVQSQEVDDEMSSLKHPGNIEEEQSSVGR